MRPARTAVPTSLVLPERGGCLAGVITVLVLSGGVWVPALVGWLWGGIA